EVVRIITPGTVVEENLLKSFENNFLCFVFFGKKNLHLTFADVSTAELYHLQIEKHDSNSVKTNFEKFPTSEVLVFKEHAILWDNLDIRTQAKLSLLNSQQIPLPQKEETFEIQKVINQFISRNFKESRFDFHSKEEVNLSSFLSLDYNTIKNLNLLENENPNEKSHTLFDVLNFTKTSSGKRLLKKKILFPLTNESQIQAIWEKIEKLSSNKNRFQELQNYLNEFSDLERLLARFKAKKVFPRDFRTIQKNIELTQKIFALLQSLNLSFEVNLEKLKTVQRFISERLYEGELPALLGNGQFLKTGFSEELDSARLASTQGKDWILELEEKERKRTGLNTLKIRYNKVVGYYIELSRKDAALVPKDYIKKQTLVTSERFSLPELEELERKILHADEVIARIEEEEFHKMIQFVLNEEKEFYHLATQIAELDYLQTLAACKENYGWIKPIINHNGEIFIEEGRHPVVEAHLTLGESFIKNNTYLNTTNEAIAILTGPNMAGKSTYMRQIAIIQILFQMGSFVPAKKADLSIVDKLFTRIGSADNLTRGESTFYLEMKESAYILKNRTEKSLILFDEIGRGTSTYDGLSLAWAIVEHLSKVTFDGKRTKTIFATHYHELTELEKEHGVFNLYMDTQEKEGNVIFLRKVKKGKAKKSFGIYVAKLAGIPDSIVERAAEILSGLESKKREIKYKQEEPSLFSFSTSNLAQNKFQELQEQMKNLDIDSLTPKQALDFLYELKAKYFT
ncbi:MAG: DNA mismatch repair protein MutS, partial [Leptospiraceae bacterium]|nr:DNA mismatch repair protein MutS [Leptospiraceae bacterium]